MIINISRIRRNRRCFSILVKKMGNCFINNSFLVILDTLSASVFLYNSSYKVKKIGLTNNFKRQGFSSKIHTVTKRIRYI